MRVSRAISGNEGPQESAGLSEVGGSTGVSKAIRGQGGQQRSGGSTGVRGVHRGEQGHQRSGIHSGSFPDAEPAVPSQMQSLTSCQCSVCSGCFQQHFTIAVRDKHIRDMVCPVCWEPDINDPEHLNSYFSTLDIQVGHHMVSSAEPLKRLPKLVELFDPGNLHACHNAFLA